MKHRWMTGTLAMCMALLLPGCAPAADHAFTSVPSAEELFVNLPEMDLSLYNEFHISLTIAGYHEENNRDFAMTGRLEVQKEISHISGLEYAKDYTSEPARKGTAESWADFGKNLRYTDLGNGWKTGQIAQESAITDLADAINSREHAELKAEDDAYMVSWKIPVTDGLFNGVIAPYVDDTGLSKSGRITAVFNPDTRQFERLNIVLSINDEMETGAVLDAVLTWETKNSDEKTLKIPENMAAGSYETVDGIRTDGGSDADVDTLAKSFVHAFDGDAELAHTEDSASLFWTGNIEETATAVNYVKTDDPGSHYQDSLDFLHSFFGDPVEENGDEICFYSQSLGELILLSRGDNWCAQITVGGLPDTPQGDLRKPLITCKTGLGI